MKAFANVGFPVKNLDKYLNLIKNSNFEIEILSTPDGKAHTQKEFIINSNVENLLIKISNIDINSLSIKEAYCIIEKINEEAKKYLEELNNG